MFRCIHFAKGDDLILRDLLKFWSVLSEHDFLMPKQTKRSVLTSDSFPFNRKLRSSLLPGNLEKLVLRVEPQQGERDYLIVEVRPRPARTPFLAD